MKTSTLQRSCGFAAALLVAAGSSGCAVVSVAATVGSAAVSVGGAAVSVGGAVVGSTVRVAGKVVEKTIDVATPGGAPAPK